MRYDVLLCDADNTLFDFNKAEENAFAMACETMGFSSTPELLATYSKINEALWKLLEQGGITQDVLRVRRFEQFLEVIHREDDAQKMCDAFVDALGRQSVPLDGAVEAVKRWSDQRHWAGAARAHGRKRDSPVYQRTGHQRRSRRGEAEPADAGKRDGAGTGDGQEARADARRFADQRHGSGRERGG